MTAQVVPIFPSDLVSPGVIYFARLDSQRPGDINAWWLVLRCSEGILPPAFLSSKDPQARAFPFWVIGRNQFIWLPRDALFLLHPSQKKAFERTGYHSKFAHYYELATGSAKGDALAVFQREIEAARDHHVSQDAARMSEVPNHLRGISYDSERPEEEDESLFIAEEGAREANGSPLIEANEQSRRKRQRTAPRAESRALTVPPRRTASRDVAEILEVRNLRPSSPPVHIKTEAEESQHRFARAIHSTERVRIFIGTRQFQTSRRAIDKSPVLASYIQRDEVGMFIMHPKLNNTEVSDFLSVLDFMQRGEITPKVIDPPSLVGRSKGSGNGNGSGSSRSNGERSRKSIPLALEGLQTSTDYSTELIRAGRLYLLGKMFQITDLNPYLVHRITTTEYHTYIIAAIITLARIIFTGSGSHRAGYHQKLQSQSQSRSQQQQQQQRQQQQRQQQEEANAENNNDDEEPMEQWIISILAENFREIMHDKNDRDLFWKMERETVARRVVAEVYERCARNYRAVGGIPVKID